jgi:hypothetical protein
MKKLALILAFLVIPCAAFGLEMLNDSAMDQVTGQSGVHIALDDVQLFINIDKLAWIDCDGLDNYAGCSGDPGALALNNFQIDVLNMNAITTSTNNGEVGEIQSEGTTAMSLYSVACGDIPLFYNYGSTAMDGCHLNVARGVNTKGLDHYRSFNSLVPGAFTASALTIDATEQLPAISAGVRNNGGSASLDIGGVYISLPTVEIYINSMSMTPVFDSDINGSTATALNDDNTTNPVALLLLGGENADFGTIYMQGITFSVLSGWLEIAPH